MKVCVVPAQITTVEDTIAGSLTLNQLLLLIAPVFLSCLIFMMLPPFMYGALYKFVIMSLALLICSALAVRVKGMLVVFWLLVLVRYNIRPRYYIYNKNDMHLRMVENDSGNSSMEDESESETLQAHLSEPELSLSEYIKLDQFLNNPAISMRFQPGKRGGIDVLIAEVER